MGRTTGSSSKRKSSKSKKPKLSSQTRKKKTIKRNKSKKLRRRDDSASYSDESGGSLSVSVSDSEDDYKSRKARSCVRDTKHRKKRVRRSLSSSSRESSVDSPRVKKKRKRSKRSGESKVRRKGEKKKKPRRKASFCSSSSDEESCSSGQNGSSSGSGESDVERRRGRSRDKKKHKKRLGIFQKVPNKRKMRSRSCSSCSRFSNSSYDQSMEKVTDETNSRRLKSVIVAKPYHEEETQRDKDEYKEEILYDQEDDYPSSRSNDSNDVGKRDVFNDSHTSFENRSVGSLIGIEDSICKFTSKESNPRSGDMDHSVDFDNDSAGARIKDLDKKNEIGDSATVAGPRTEDIESILRRKALENLMKFRGPKTQMETLTHHENKIEGNVSLSIKKDDFVEDECERELSSGICDTQSVYKNKRSTLTNDSSLQTEENKLDGRGVAIECKAGKQTVSRPSHGAAISSSIKGKDMTSVLNKETESNTVSLKQVSAVSSFLPNQVPPLDESLQRTSLVTKKVIDSAAETSQNLGRNSSNNQNVGSTNVCAAAPEPSSDKPTVVDPSSKESQDVANPNSQFEQKTMSVMRGGEMVQVSYKVYIPNKAPALARRRLQR